MIFCVYYFVILRIYLWLLLYGLCVETRKVIALKERTYPYTFYTET